MMAAATVIEKLYGTIYATDWVYHNPLFIILWAVAAISGVVMLIQRRTIRLVIRVLGADVEPFEPQWRK